MVSFKDDAGLPALLNPNKVSTNCNKNMYSKWPKNALDVLLVEVMDHVPTEEVFDKLSNPLLNGLKNFSSSNEVFCPKCSKLTKVSKNGKTKDTYQFSCNGAEKMHYISATQILETIPDEWIADLVEIFDNPYRVQILDWINKEHLSPEIWDLKGLKNATKRFSTQLSPVKDNMIKIRAVNSGLEEENRRLRDENANLSSELRDLKRTMQALTEEVSSLRRYLLETKIDSEVMSGKPSATEPVERTFATVASIHRPPSSKRTLNMTPLEVISKPKNPTPSNDRPPYSPLKIYFFEGCHRKSPGIYRKMLTDLGFNSRQVRDIMFLSDDIMQVTTYESAIEELSNILLGISTSVRRLDNFNPIKGDNYSKYGTFSDEEVKAGYFAMMTKSAERLTKAAESVKALKRSANFLNKVVENQKIDYQSAPRKEKVFFLGNLIDYIKPTRPIPEVTNIPKDDHTEEVEITDTQQQ
jgi:uncharacterized protein YeeX (DUF496 family)